MSWLGKIILLLVVSAVYIVAIRRFLDDQLTLLECCGVIIMSASISIAQTLSSLEERIRDRIFEQQHAERRGFR